MYSRLPWVSGSTFVAFIVAAAVWVAHVDEVAAGDVYRSTGEAGETLFSDSPGPGAQRVKVAPLPTIPGEPYRLSPSLEPEPQPEPASNQLAALQNFAIVFPGEDEPVRANGGSVTVRLTLPSPLKPEHSVRLYLDGDLLVKDLRAASAELLELDRGVHELYAALVDRYGQELSTDSKRFHVLRRSILLGPLSTSSAE